MINSDLSRSHNGPRLAKALVALTLVGGLARLTSPALGQEADGTNYLVSADYEQILRCRLPPHETTSGILADIRTRRANKQEGVIIVPRAGADDIAYEVINGQRTAHNMDYTEENVIALRCIMAEGAALRAAVRHFEKTKSLFYGSGEPSHHPCRIRQLRGLNVKCM
ncbi:MAG: hypothetical protein R3B72_24520 [Polyangiaceae bacterium]